MEASTTTATIDPVERIQLEALPAAQPVRGTGRLHPSDRDGVWADLLAPDAPFRRSSGRGLLSGLAKRAARLLRPAERNFLVDAAMLGLAALAAVITAPDAGIPVEATGWLLAFPLLTLALLATRGMYQRVSGLRFLEDVRTIVCMAAVAAMAVTFVRVLFGDEPYAASQALRELLFAVVYLAAGRYAVQIVELKLRSRGGGGSRTLIVGAGRVGHLLATRLLDRPEIGLRPVGFVDDQPLEGEETPGCPVLGRVSDLAPVVEDGEVEHAILSFSRASHDEALAVSRQLHEMGVSVSVVPRLFEDMPDRTSVDRVGGFPLLTIHPSNPRSWQVKVKYACDRILAGGATLLVSPILIGIGLGVMVTMGRPIFFRQRRVGLDGHEFEMLKFRSMSGGPDPSSAEALQNAFDHGLAPGGVEGKDRRTKLGAFLRRTSLDELPQLINVLRGDMSVVGPRPERDNMVPLFEQSVHRYEDRHRVKSGITGWAQVHGLRGQTSLADRVEWDNYYIENWSLWLDLKIMLMTVLAVFRDRSE
jgi:exopolysaccharide biosynthesis polyprenyl glycosylphosphotransferase